MRTILLAFVLAATTAAAFAQTHPARKPAPARPAATATRPAPARPTSDGQGEYVAPDMTGAPNDRVTTDYANRPLKKPAAGSSTLSSQKKPAAPKQ